ncbi:MAG: hypothetical protein VB120_07615 [Lachnospiraceae bacterium]|nr:hypothetical protein [Lachnospiraceae bacterium]
MRFNLPGSVSRNVLVIDNFRGVDLHNSPANIDMSRSPYAPNMIRDVPGKVRKRMGYALSLEYEGKINGVFYLGDKRIVHAGEKLFESELGSANPAKEVYDGMADQISKAWQINSKLYIMDGKNYIVYGEFENPDYEDSMPVSEKKIYTAKPVSETAYVPTIVISRSPTGGGTTLEPINLLQSKWTESFLGEASVEEYQLTTDELDQTPVTARKLNSSGDWVDLTENTHFSVNRQTGTITFLTAPGESPVAGQDNVEITASKKRGEKEYVSFRFAGDGQESLFSVSAEEPTSSTPIVKQMDSQGNFTTLSSSTDYTYDAESMTVSFTLAPPLPPDGYESNIEISVEVYKNSYISRINKCSVSVLYGVNGESNRIFATGNPDFINRDFYSQMDDPTYFGDIWYCTLGQDEGGITGYGIINNYLAAFKSSDKKGQNVIMRKGTLSDDTASFPVINTLKGEGAIAKNAVGYLGNESLFLTSLGIAAITSEDITGEKYSQNRSFYINNSLCAEEDMENSFGFNYKDFFILSVGSKFYILDGLQKSYEKNMPYSTYQYECYVWENINARILFEEKGALCFGDENGKIYRFYQDPENPENYNDNGSAIDAVWELPDINGKIFYKNKTFKRVEVSLASAIATGVKIFAKKRGIWSEIFDGGAKARYLDFNYVNFDKLNFSSDTTPRTLGGRISLRKADKLCFKLENSSLNEPFGIYAVALEYTENGNYKI